MSPIELSESNINREAAEQTGFGGIKLSLIMKQPDLKENSPQQGGFIMRKGACVIFCLGLIATLLVLGGLSPRPRSR